MSLIEIRDAGPIKLLTISVRDAGGVHTLVGRNGTGKSTALAAVESLATGEGKVPVRDSAQRAEVSGFGVTMKVTSRTSRSGVLMCESLDGDLNVSDLVDPGIADPVAADNRRIKLLLQLAGVKAEPSHFWHLVGGHEAFEQTTTASREGDILSMAGRAKRDWEKRARLAEESAQAEQRLADGELRLIEGVNVDQECDSSVLQDRLSSAIRKQTELKSKLAEGQRLAKERARAEEMLSMSAEGPSIDQAALEVEQAQSIVEGRTSQVSQARAALEAAKRALSDAETELNTAKAALKAADDRHVALARLRDTLAAWRKTIDTATAFVPPDASDIIAADAAVDQVQWSIEQAEVVRRAKSALVSREVHMGLRRQHEELANRMREAAAGTDGVLTLLVSTLSTPIRVAGGRLVTDTDRGETLFAELSAGERCKLAVDIVLQSFHDTTHRPIVVLSQELWESLDPTNRKIVHNHAVERGVVVLTAEATDDDELRCVPMDMMEYV